MKSIQRQLSISLAMGTLAILVIAALYAASSLSHEIEEGFDSALKEAAQRLLLVFELALKDSELVNAHEAQVNEIQMGLPEPYKMHDLLLSYVVRDKNQNVLLRSRVAHEEIFPETFVAGFQTRSSHRLYAVQSAQSGVSIVVAEPMAHRAEALWESLTAFAIPLLFLVPLSLLLAWYVVRRSMTSVNTLKQQIEQRGESNLQAVTVAGLPDELRPIANSVNDMLERLNRALDAERNFATHSAHELRTPIASSLNQIQRQIACLPEGAEQLRAKQIEVTLSNLARTSEKLMQLSRAESGFLVSEDLQDVYPVIEHVVDDFSRVLSAKNRIVLKYEHEPVLLARLDTDGFGILLRNLIENAIKHGDNTADIFIVVDSKQNSLRILNECQVILGATLESLRSRFSRGDTAASGSGLGLAIVDSLAVRADMRVSYYSPMRGKTSGFEVVVQV